ncbi:MAG: hypothetical protein DI551_05435 [Micavibrio aeruginosavorus]|uniref:Uncharacterized protein n=1 Tax=Micavibrio aeruginosavorus TaxID=349221 RepID=A0A2W5PNJ7_9BACT|nr:MAG: hypothetical protein DI551_05435 [Micavibrio aeruginosavorus]
MPDLNAGKELALFSQLGPLFRSHLRQAEKSDARLDIPREEKHGQGKKNDDKSDTEDTSALWEDSTLVSVEALKTFLLEFLKTRGETSGAQTAGQTQEPSAYTDLTPEYRPPVNNRAARAVKAYGAIAAQTAPPPEPPVAPSEPIDLGDLLQADELRTIHGLIADLDGFTRSGTTHLVIEKADTFLEALVQAVRAEKNKATP